MSRICSRVSFVLVLAVSAVVAGCATRAPVVVTDAYPGYPVPEVPAELVGRQAPDDCQDRRAQRCAYRVLAPVRSVAHVSGRYRPRFVRICALDHVDQLVTDVSMEWE